MNEVPSFFQLMTSFDTRCTHQCEACRFGGVHCRADFFYQILTGSMTLDDSFEKPNKEKPEPNKEKPEPNKEEPKPESELPSWCKAGQWVTDGDPAHRLGVIDEVFSDARRVWVIWFHNANGCTGSTTLTKFLKPVRFRPYTFEEAKGLIGKVMEHNEDGVLPAVAIIGIVWLDGSEVYYNSFSFKDLQNWNATIDGVPLGVPEIDKEAMKKEEQ